MVGRPVRRENREKRERGELPAVRPPKRTYGVELTQELADAILLYALEGGFKEDCFARAGVSRDVFRGWLERGAHDLREGIASNLATFVTQFDAALAEARQEELGAIRAHGLRPKVTKTIERDGEGKEKTIEREESGDWRALAWRLERMNPDKFAARVRLEVEREIDELLSTLEAELDQPTYVRVLEVVARRESQETGS